MAEFNGYHYNHQLRRYLVQFMAIFAGMQVQVGWKGDTEPRLIKVPIRNTSEDRVVADIFSENTQNKVNRVPMMTAGLRAINMSPERRHGVGSVHRSTYIPSGGLVPDDIRVVKQRMPVPYIGNFELTMWVSNQDQHYQLMEQILAIFNPILELQTSDAVLDPTRITSCELTGIQLDEEPPGTERRLIRSTLSFDVVLYITIPALAYESVVRDIFVRVAAVSQNTNFSSSADIVAAAESTGLDYEHWFNSSDIDFPQE